MALLALYLGGALRVAVLGQVVRAFGAASLRDSPCGLATRLLTPLATRVVRAARGRAIQNFRLVLKAASLSRRRNVKPYEYVSQVQFL